MFSKGFFIKGYKELKLCGNGLDRSKSIVFEKDNLNVAVMFAFISENIVGKRKDARFFETLCTTMTVKESAFQFTPNFTCPLMFTFFQKNV